MAYHYKDVDNTYGLISCYGSVFNVIDLGGDLIEKGAYQQTIKELKANVAAGKTRYLLPMLWQHDANQPIGGWTSLVEDDYGLLCHGQILLSIPKGREAYELLKDGTIHSFSIGYDVMTGGSTYVKNTRVLTALRLWELSVVTFPMCEEATLESIKSYTKHSVRYHYEQAISR